MKERQIYKRPPQTREHFFVEKAEKFWENWIIKFSGKWQKTGELSSKYAVYKVNVGNENYRIRMIASR